VHRQSGEPERAVLAGRGSDEPQLAQPGREIADEPRAVVRLVGGDDRQRACLDAGLRELAGEQRDEGLVRQHRLGSDRHRDLDQQGRRADPDHVSRARVGGPPHLHVVDGDRSERLEVERLAVGREREVAILRGGIVEPQSGGLAPPNRQLRALGHPHRARRRVAGDEQHPAPGRRLRR
jgi:hypothetical protein